MGRFGRRGNWIGYQTNKAGSGANVETKDFSLGARGSYAFTKALQGPGRTVHHHAQGARAQINAPRSLWPGALALNKTSGRASCGCM